MTTNMSGFPSHTETAPSVAPVLQSASLIPTASSGAWIKSGTPHIGTTVWVPSSCKPGPLCTSRPTTRLSSRYRPAMNDKDFNHICWSVAFTKGRSSARLARTTSNFSSVAALTSRSRVDKSDSSLKAIRTELKPKYLITWATCDGAGAPCADECCARADIQLTPTSFTRLPFVSVMYRPETCKGSATVSSIFTCGLSVGNKIHVCVAGAPWPFWSVSRDASPPLSVPNPAKSLHCTRVKVPLMEPTHLPPVFSCNVSASHWNTVSVIAQGHKLKIPPCNRKHSDATTAV
mmetsp:Transcript_82518/g.231422  ORF Transcript_82518/g.231422 Transcript_82518/m.231422 type:complete len:290 (+) Transcript_82518:1204-2073(+)